MDLSSGALFYQISMLESTRWPRQQQNFLSVCLFQTPNSTSLGAIVGLMGKFVDCKKTLIACRFFPPQRDLGLKGVLEVLEVNWRCRKVWCTDVEIYSAFRVQILPLFDTLVEASL